MGVFHFSWNRPEGWLKRPKFPHKTFGTFFLYNSFETHPKHIEVFHSIFRSVKVFGSRVKDVPFLGKAWKF